MAATLGTLRMTTLSDEGCPVAKKRSINKICNVQKSNQCPNKVSLVIAQSNVKEQSLCQTTSVSPLKGCNKYAKCSKQSVTRLNVASDPKLCLFCQKVYKKRCKSLTYLSDAKVVLTLKKISLTLDDNRIYSFLQTHRKDEVKYHRQCYASYLLNDTSKGSQRRNASSSTTVHDEAFTCLVSEIQNDLENQHVFKLKDLLSRYQYHITTLEPNASLYRADKLKIRLKKHFSNNIEICSDPNPSRSNTVFSGHISVQDAITTATRLNDTLESTIIETHFHLDEDSQESLTKEALTNAASTIRSAMKQCKGLTAQEQVDSLQITLDKSEEMIPKELYVFLRLIISEEEYDPNKDNYKLSDAKLHRQVIGIASSIMYASSNGKKKFPIQVGMGMTIKHLTGSKRLISILNKLGHSCSYDEILRIETSLANQVQDTSNEDTPVIPTNIGVGAFIHAAANNIDFNEGTIDGKGTTHATSIVLYQRNDDDIIERHTASETNLKKRQRSMSTQEDNVNNGCPQANINCRKTSAPTNNVDFTPLSLEKTAKAKLNDLAYDVCRMGTNSLFTINIDENIEQNMPCWTAYNAVISKCEVPLTKIGYCPLIQSPPTSYETVYDVMTYIQNVCKELGQNYSVLTLDEAIYCKGKEIQWKRDDEFKGMIIKLGGFHIAKTFLACIGKVFECSGLEELLINSGMYGPSTTSQILGAKSYNRAVRAHKLVKEALQRLLLTEFNTEWQQTQIKNAIQKAVNECSDAFISGDVQSCQSANDQLLQEIPALQNSLDEFKAEKSRMSPTFEFWVMYIDMVDILLRFLRAEREGTWALHVEAFEEMLPYFFALGRGNYSRWGSVYITDMKSLSTTAPEVYEEFIKGNHVVKRSLGKFNQVSADLALEQSINKDSKGHGGVIGISHKPRTLARWFLTAHVRGAITSQTLSMCSFNTTSNGHHKEIGKERKFRDERDVRSVVQTIQETMTNPFSETQNTNLINIANGVIASEEVMSDMNHLKAKGNEMKTKFINERIKTNDVEIFNTLPKVKISTFAKSESDKSKCKTTNATELLKEERKFLSRIVILSQRVPVDLQDMLKYEMTSIPTSLAQPDGSLRRTNKALLLADLEQLIESTPQLPSQLSKSVHIFDGMSIVHAARTSDLSTFGDLSKRLLDTILTPLQSDDCDRVDVIFDSYNTESSIKACEQQRRSHVSPRVSIKGAITPLPKQWNSYLSNKDNKIDLLNFLTTDWSSRSENMMSRQTELYVAGGYNDSTNVKLLTDVSIQDIPALYSSQEEADTRILLHAKQAVNHGFQNIVIHSVDTDVALLGIHFQSQLNVPTWFITGTGIKRRCIPLHEIANTLGPDKCQLLLPCHALSGCDTTSAILRFGKLKPWHIVEQNTNDLRALGNLGNDMRVSQATIQAVETLICKVYAPKLECSSVDEMRFVMFSNKQTEREKLPPSSHCLQHHIQRVNYQTYIWKSALQAKPVLPSPTEHGWQMIDGHLRPLWMTIKPAPENLMSIISCKCRTSKCRKRCSCRQHKLPCTSLCACKGDEECENPHSLDDDESNDSQESDDDLQ